ncbi:NnrS family protein [Nitratireductor alexandrii]|uniref:NnrS family protein n=1 Tax=Nitratireductor alexandrii TaxID=2448161 RepID=UPI000FDB4CB7|nr:NnrS family protein [Nitratireductor alexandrii]
MTVLEQHGPTDRSVLRRRRGAGDDGRDGRGRVPSTLPILHYGFRPFFLLAALHAGLAIPAWLLMFRTGWTPAGPFAALDWHVHEMLFGYLGAVIAGFVLTAVPNWTGRLPLSGGPLAGLVGLWFLGRAANLTVGDPLLAMAADLAFPLVLAAAVWREVVAGRNWRNAPVAAMLTLFALANGLHHSGAFAISAAAPGMRLALGVATVLIALIGGRIVPSFTRNWLARNGDGRLPASFGIVDKAALAATVAAVAAWVAVPDLLASGGLLVLAGTLLAVRLARWRGDLAIREPIVLVLHLGYGWLAAAVFLLGAAILAPGLPASAAVHALTAGAVGTMTLAVMTRASLGHTGRAIEADGWTLAIYAAVSAGALLRVAAPFSDTHYLTLLTAGGTLWSLAFLLFALRYGPILCKPRKG